MLRYRCAVVGLLLVLLALAVVPLHAAEGNCWNMGETLPLTLYLRLKRQSEGVFGLFGGTEAPETDGGVEVDVTGQRFNAALPSGQHRNQVKRPLPPVYLPRFGINKLTRLDVPTWMKRAEKDMAGGPSVVESEIAVRFSVGGGLNKETTWLPLATRRSELESRMMAMMHPAAQQEMMKAAELGAPQSEIRYLDEIYFYYGYQTGEVNRLTSFKVECIYGVNKRDNMTLHYVWDEHRAYNPHRALTLCSAFALGVAMFLIASILNRHGKAAVQFNRKVVAVRQHED